MKSGRFKFFYRARGFGFIVPDEGGPDVFVHATDLTAAGIFALPNGTPVLYEAHGSGARCRAISIRIPGVNHDVTAALMRRGRQLVHAAKNAPTKDEASEWDEDGRLMILAAEALTHMEGAHHE